VELTDEELGVLVETCDADNDGRIGLEDFRSLSMRCGKANIDTSEDIAS